MAPVSRLPATSTMGPSPPGVRLSYICLYARDADGRFVYAVKTGRWGGVVTAFITMSDIKDEIDWEFPGNQTTEGQSNYFWQGVVRTSAFCLIPASCPS